MNYNIETVGLYNKPVRPTVKKTSFFNPAKSQPMSTGSLVTEQPQTATINLDEIKSN